MCASCTRSFFPVRIRKEKKMRFSFLVTTSILQGYFIFFFNFLFELLFRSICRKSPNQIAQEYMESKKLWSGQTKGKRKGATFAGVQQINSIENVLSGKDSGFTFLKNRHLVRLKKKQKGILYKFECVFSILSENCAYLWTKQKN